MAAWPSIAEPELLERLAMDDREFAEYLRRAAAALPRRGCDAAAVERALGYPWARPLGSYLLRGSDVELLAGASLAERRRVFERFASTASGRSPLLAIGSNAAPAALARKLAHFEDAEDRTVLALAGKLRDFDVGAAAYLTLYGSMPATLFPNPGAAVAATLLWVTPNQLTQLTWSELSYRLGVLKARFDAHDDDGRFDEVLAFVSRYGAFCQEGRPVALAAVPASGRTAAALTQAQLLDAAAALVLGPGNGAEDLVRAALDDMVGLVVKMEATVEQTSLPFASERWAPLM